MGADIKRTARPWTAVRVVRGIRKYGPQAVVDCVAVSLAYLTVFGIRTGAKVDPGQLADAIVLSVSAGCAQVAANVLFTVYWRNWGLAALEDLAALVKAVIAQVLALFLADFAFGTHPLSPGIIAVGGVFVIGVESALMLRPRWPEMIRAARGDQSGRPRAIVVGAGHMGQLLVRDLATGSSLRVVCFVDDDARKWGTYVRGIRIEGAVKDLPDLIARYAPETIVIAMRSPGGPFIRTVFEQCEHSDVRIRVVQGFGLGDDTTAIRPLVIGELLEREEVALEIGEARARVSDRTVLVTGAAGSIGSEVARQIVRLGPRRLVMLDMDESGLHDAAATLGAATYDIRLGDVRDSRAMRALTLSEKPDIIFHAAAYKHVAIVENNPLPAIASNVLGTARLLEAAAASNVERFIFISTDKAVRPSSLMGMTKRFGELLVLAFARDLDKRFAVVRFGNVLGSRGSVVPIFNRQLDQGGPLTVTDPEATRYFMTIPEASSLVIHASAIADGGDLLVLDMGRPVLIADLARKMIRLRGLRQDDVAIDFIGLRAGEKMHEELHYPDEVLAPSRHARVLRVVQGPPTPSLAQLCSVIKDLELAVGDSDAAAAIQLVRSVTCDRRPADDDDISPAPVAEPMETDDDETGA